MQRGVEPMLGTIIGDIAGLRFMFRNHKGKNFEIFHEDCEFTDDSVMTLDIVNLKRILKICRRKHFFI